MPSGMIIAIEVVNGPTILSKKKKINISLTTNDVKNIYWRRKCEIG